MTVIRSAYSERVRVQLDFMGQATRTKSSFQAECDINTIMSKYAATGLVSHVRQHAGDYSDLSDGVDYQRSMDMMIAAQAAFGSLPAKIRTRFGNDPTFFLDFVADPANREEMDRMGLLKVKPVVVPTPAPIVAPVSVPVPPA